MTLDYIRAYLLSKPYVTEDLPFGPDTLVFRVGEKIFALCGLDNHPLRINLKCAPENVLELREEHAWIIPGYHMNKKHWNTIIFTDDSNWKLIKILMDHSYDLVFQSLPKKIKETLTEY